MPLQPLEGDDVIRVTANTNRRAPAMSAEDAAVIAAGFGIRQPLASSDIGHSLDEAGLSRLVDKVHDAMVDDALIGIDMVSISELRMDLCRPMPFRALKRPGIGDFIGDLTPGSGNDRRD